MSITRSDWDRLWAEARARGEYPPLIDYFTVPDAELGQVGQREEVNTWTSTKLT
jgi:hypothetical protein